MGSSIRGGITSIKTISKRIRHNLGLLDFAAQKRDDTHVFAQIVTGSAHVIGYSIDTISLQATELWKVPNVRLYGKMAAPIVALNKKNNDASQKILNKRGK